MPAALHALQWFVDANNLPVDYIGHGIRLFDLTGGIVAYLGEDMAMLHVNEGTVSGTTTVPAGYTLGAQLERPLRRGWLGGSRPQLFPGPTFAYLTPEVAGVSIAIEALASPRVASSATRSARG